MEEKSEILVLCDKTSKPARSNQRILTPELNTSSAKKKDQSHDKIYLATNNIKRLMIDNLSPVMEDLLEIATFVYVAGQLTSRGGLRELEYGAKWFRHFDMVVPVRELELWNKQKELLEEILEFVSGERYTFDFKKKDRGGPSWFDCKKGLEPEKDYTDVVLLSGGLDSFTGAMQEITTNNKTIFVSHQSETKMTSLQNNVFEYIKTHSDSKLRPYHIPVKIFKGESYVTKDTNQRSRSFLFAALGAVVANCLGLDEVKFYENGIISCNLPFDRQTYQSQRTRSTHPKFLKLMSQMMSEILEKEFSFINPFFNKTRMEVIRHLISMHHQEGIKITRSCASSRYEDGWRHDGTCSQCVDRRFATLATDCSEYDEKSDYQLNIFCDELAEGHDRTMVLNYIGMARTIQELQNTTQFARKYSSDILEIVTYLGINREAGLAQILDLYRRHAKDVLAVLKSQYMENLDNITQGKLPNHCALRLGAAPDTDHSNNQLALPEVGDFANAVSDQVTANLKPILETVYIKPKLAETTPLKRIGRPKHPKETIDRVISLKKEGKSWKEIGQAMGLSRRAAEGLHYRATNSTKISAASKKTYTSK